MTGMRLMIRDRAEIPPQWLADVADLSFDERRRLQAELRDRLESADGVLCAFPLGKSASCLTYCVRQRGYKQAQAR